MSPGRSILRYHLFIILLALTVLAYWLLGITRQSRRLGSSASISSSTFDDAGIAMCLVVKDEPDVSEWVDYHHRTPNLAINKIYIFDHGSNPPLNSLPALAAHIASGVVTYEYTPYRLDSFLRIFSISRPNPQTDLYDRCLSLHRDKHRYLAFLDVDEFIVLRDDGRHNSADNTNNSSSSISGRRSEKAGSLLQLLDERYSGYGGLALNWMVFGSSGHTSRPPTPTYQHYNACYPSIHIKSIVNTRYVARASPNPHWFEYAPGSFAVNELGIRTDSWFSSPPSFQTIYLNHYSVKSRRDFDLKRKRGRHSKTLARSHTTWEYFDETNAKAVNVCEPLLPPAPRS